jgi:hypothetical protein
VDISAARFCNTAAIPGVIEATQGVLGAEVHVPQMVSEVYSPEEIKAQQAQMQSDHEPAPKAKRAPKRETFEVPPGHVAVMDDEGRATGELEAIDPTPKVTKDELIALLNRYAQKHPDKTKGAKAVMLKYGADKVTQISQTAWDALAAELTAYLA